MTDRSKFILNTSAEFFSQNVSSQQSDDGSIQEFIQNDEINILAATFSENTLRFHHTVPTDENCLLFYKIPQFGLAKSTTPEIPIGMLTLEGGLVKSIYNSVSMVYAPHVTMLQLWIFHISCEKRKRPSVCNEVSFGNEKYVDLNTIDGDKMWNGRHSARQECLSNDNRFKIRRRR